MGLRTLLDEVMDVTGKDELDDDVIDTASDILKLVKAKELLQNSFNDKTRLRAMRIIATAQQSSVEDIYDEILERRGSC